METIAKDIAFQHMPELNQKPHETGPHKPGGPHGPKGPHHLANTGSNDLFAPMAGIGTALLIAGGLAMVVIRKRAAAGPSDRYDG